MNASAHEQAASGDRGGLFLKLARGNSLTLRPGDVTVTELSADDDEVKRIQL